MYEAKDNAKHKTALERRVEPLYKSPPSTAMDALQELDDKLKQNDQRKDKLKQNDKPSPETTTPRRRGQIFARRSRIK
jgi:hypothetical protein